MERVILHADANSFYASVACFFHPEYKSVPMAVCGDPAQRHGIVLAKNQHAKKFNIQTGDTVWQARKKCPQLVIVPPDFSHYQQFSKEMRRIFLEYTPYVEPMGMDECWLDVSAKNFTIKDGTRLADEIRHRIWKEIGITVSVGVSFTKTFAKLGSDLKKPNATTTISPENFKDIVWPLSADSMIFVGPHTMKRLTRLGLWTIGDLAACDDQVLYQCVGKWAPSLKKMALGEEISSVGRLDSPSDPKSLSASTTPSHDINTMEEAKHIFYILAEELSARLGEMHTRALKISVSARDVRLSSFSHQSRLSHPAALTDDLLFSAMRLFKERFSSGFPYRSLGISVSDLTCENQCCQLSFLDSDSDSEKQKSLEKAVRSLRRRYGDQVLRRASLLP